MTASVIALADARARLRPSEPALRPVADVLDPIPARRDCRCGRPECLSYADALGIAHSTISTYVSIDDAAAARLRKNLDIPGPRPEGAAARWYTRWCGDLAEALRARMHARALVILHEGTALIPAA